MPLGARNSEDQFILDRVKNQPRTAEGAVLPPRFFGGRRVPVVTNLRVVRAESFSGGTAFTLVFDLPIGFSNIDKFNVFYSTPGLAYNFAGACVTSPATFRVVSDTVQQVTFQVQTVLKNGFVSDTELSPTCTGYTIAGTISGSDIPNGSLGLNKLVGGAVGTVITGQGVGVTPQYTALNSSALNLVFGGNNLTVTNRIPYVNAAATLEDDVDLTFNPTPKRLSTRQIELSQSLAVGVAPAVVANTTLDRTANVWPINASGGVITVTLPLDADSVVGQTYILIAIDGTNTITLAPSGSDNINGVNASLSMPYTGAVIRLVKTSANNWWAF